MRASDHGITTLFVNYNKSSPPGFEATPPVKEGQNVGSVGVSAPMILRRKHILAGLPYAE